MKVSVTVPVYEYYGRGVEFLDDMFRTISHQTLKDVEVVVSDHSIDSIIEDYCKLNEYDLTIKYIRNDLDRGNPCSNTNVAIDNSSGEVVKVLLQDDFLYDTEALEKIYYELKNSTLNWLVCGCIHTRDDGHTFFNSMYPRWSDNMILHNGNNFIGSPSVLSFKKEVDIRFDSKTAMLMDVDFYYNMKLKYDHPIYMDDILIGNRVRDTQTWKERISDEEIDNEFKYVYEKYQIKL
jgi:glycosyltransferase involved in cell wall biosynthesis